MTSSTTLMTFLVRTPPTTKSVSLLGSWDNFSRPYPMKRDTRVGPEHWTGCHSYENIICDGNLNSTGNARDGGLKMGGTYWYYYQLDQEIEFHNSAEPSTTSCPLLPGQLVNVLHVPIHLSNGRLRNDSVSSTSSDLRTMDPSDRFVNPRPVPQPVLHRLTTSPSLLPQPSLSSEHSPASGSPWSAQSLSSSRDTSQQSSAATLRAFRLPRKASIDGQSRSVSPGAISTSLRAAIRQLTSPRSASPETESTRGRLGQLENQDGPSDPLLLNRINSGRVSKPSSTSSSRSASRDPSPAAIRELPGLSSSSSQLGRLRGFQQGVMADEGLSVPSFQNHRRQRSRSNEPSILRKSLIMIADQIPEDHLTDVSGPRPRPLETVTEAPSSQNTPTWPLTATKTTHEVMAFPSVEAATEKRLPTLPNTPSSVYPASVPTESPLRRLSDQIRNLKSRFSELTISTSSEHSPDEKVRSRFSEWSTTTLNRSPTSNFSPILAPEVSPMNADMAFSSHPHSPFEFPSMPQSPSMSEIQDDSLMLENVHIPSSISYSSINSLDSTTPSSPTTEPSGLAIVNPTDAHRAQKRFGITSDGFRGYKLPEEIQASETTLKGSEALRSEEGLALAASRVGVRRQESVSNIPTQNFSHSTSMQNLMQELSYLGDIIQR